MICNSQIWISSLPIVAVVTKMCWISSMRGMKVKISGKCSTAGVVLKSTETAMDGSRTVVAMSQVAAGGDTISWMVAMATVLVGACDFRILATLPVSFVI